MDKQKVVESLVDKCGKAHPEIFMTDVQLARVIGRAVQSLRNDRNAGQGFPYYRIGRSVRYRLDEVIGIIEASRIDPAAGGGK